ncbi:MAG: hypothetical protein IH972_07835 [Candidatus Marinimicrobia bacterium]|nr:hypothetical protein [Candidatus Neomarinimicrobiota bacterium]
MTADTKRTQKKKDRHAVALGKKGGKKGGKARAEKLSPERRKSIAEKAAAMRWGKMPQNEPVIETTASEYPSPWAKFIGELSLGGNPVDCYVLDTGERVLSPGRFQDVAPGCDHQPPGRGARRRSALLQETTWPERYIHLHQG